LLVGVFVRGCVCVCSWECLFAGVCVRGSACVWMLHSCKPGVDVSPLAIMLFLFLPLPPLPPDSLWPRVAGGGHELILSSDDAMEGKVVRQLARAMQPLLTQVTVDWGTSSCFPRPRGHCPGQELLHWPPSMCCCKRMDECRRDVAVRGCCRRSSRCCYTAFAVRRKVLVTGTRCPPPSTHLRLTSMSVSGTLTPYLKFPAAPAQCRPLYAGTRALLFAVLDHSRGGCCR
jgi:hypothetical protein